MLRSPVIAIIALSLGSPWPAQGEEQKPAKDESAKNPKKSGSSDGQAKADAPAKTDNDAKSKKPRSDDPYVAGDAERGRGRIALWRALHELHHQDPAIPLTLRVSLIRDGTGSYSATEPFCEGDRVQLEAANPGKIPVYASTWELGPDYDMTLLFPSDLAPPTESRNRIAPSQAGTWQPIGSVIRLYPAGALLWKTIVSLAPSDYSGLASQQLPVQPPTGPWATAELQLTVHPATACPRRQP